MTTFIWVAVFLASGETFRRPPSTVLGTPDALLEELGTTGGGAAAKVAPGCVATVAFHGWKTGVTFSFDRRNTITDSNLLSFLRVGLSELRRQASIPSSPCLSQFLQEHLRH
jgi:hypothetical protein